MLPPTESSEAPFMDRRNYLPHSPYQGRERRQFTNSYEDLTPPARELALAIDQYKLCHRRRFITYEEMLGVVTSLGYKKADEPTA